MSKLMERRARLEAAGISVIFAEGERAFAESIAGAVEESARFLQRCWRLRAPDECQVRVLTDACGFIADTVPRHLRAVVALTKPFWKKRAERAFGIAGGWMLPWPGRMAVGVKPPHLLAAARSEVGRRLFVPVPDLVEKARHVTCHELTHAFTAHLRLPAWINEGLAMRAVDHVAGYATVRADTSTRVFPDPAALDANAYRRVKPSDHEALLALYATGYWTIRRLEMEAPETLRQMLAQRRPRGEVDRIVAEALALRAQSGSNPAPDP